jgi:hypothetical protein
MSLIGYRNLATLKARLLPADMGDDGDWDGDLSAIGLAVAALFDRITGRELRRNTAASFECPADVESVVLKSYPVESLTSVTIAAGTGSASSVMSAVMGLQHASGIVDFGGTLGSHLDRLVIVSSGGYWCQDGDDDTKPAGATALPDELYGAWVAQCRAVCEAQNIFRAKGAEKPDKKAGGGLTLETLDVIPSVRRTLQLFMRMP